MMSPVVAQMALPVGNVDERLKEGKPSAGICCESASFGNSFMGILGKVGLR